MLDADLDEIYGIETKVLNQSVRRNKDRFPQDFMFKLSKKEYEDLRFQFGTFKNATKGRNVSESMIKVTLLS